MNKYLDLLNKANLIYTLLIDNQHVNLRPETASKLLPFSQKKQANFHTPFGGYPFPQLFPQKSPKLALKIR